MRSADIGCSKNSGRDRGPDAAPASMMDDHNNSDNRIIVRRVIRNRATGAMEEEIFKASQPGPAARWLTYLLLVPVLIVMAVLGIFFFTAFLALFAVVAAGFGLRLWWLRRKLRESM